MSSVVAFPERKDPHLSGESICSHCRHEWVNVAPVGVVNFECPACGAMKGLFKYPCVPTKYWRCNCGSDLFYITPDRIVCRECGTAQSF